VRDREMRENMREVCIRNQPQENKKEGKNKEKGKKNGKEKMKYTHVLPILIFLKKIIKCKWYEFLIIYVLTYKSKYIYISIMRCRIL
jgi:hypothetical protein